MRADDSQQYRALRDTIRDRGTTRVWIFVVGLASWAALSLATSALGMIPVATLVPLVVLAATFEGIFALHVSVERIGRYLQVFFDDRWEITAMAFGPPLAGTGSDPLFALFFGIATLLNFGPVLAAGAVRIELTIIGAAHLLFFVRIAIARQVAARQRAADLERYTHLRDGK